MHSTGPGELLRRYFSGLAEGVFETQLGVADPPLVDYISDLLVRFVRSDTIHRIRGLSGRPLLEVAEMMLEANCRIGPAKRDIHRHIGDFTLFWTGMYPEALREMCGTDRKDFFIDYCAQGKKAYMIASTISTESQQDAPADVLLRLSSQFEMCAYGLREVRREWEQGDGDEPSRPLLFT